MEEDFYEEAYRKRAFRIEEAAGVLETPSVADAQEPAAA
jgi:hypothetical protein